jgi:hypothetical protein
VVPSIGRILHYRLTEVDAKRINKRRQDAISYRVSKTMPGTALVEDGTQIHYGNDAHPGEVYPLIVTKVWEGGLVNGQVLLDGNDTLWVMSVREEPTTPVEEHPIEFAGRWSWPPRV